MLEVDNLTLCIYMHNREARAFSWRQSSRKAALTSPQGIFRAAKQPESSIDISSGHFSGGKAVSK
jgi:hypothetical protein